MGRSIKRGIYLLIACMALLLAGNSESGEDSAVAVAATQKTTKVQEELEIYHQVDWKNQKVTIRWPAVRYADRYVAICIPNGDSSKTMKWNISGEKRAFEHKIKYGASYEYEILAYLGNAVWDWTVYRLDIVPSLVRWAPYSEFKTKKSTTLVFDPVNDHYIWPMGVQIYHGKDKKHMKLLRTVRCEELSDFYPKNETSNFKKFVDKNRDHVDYYQFRSYIDIGGKRRYGKKSKIKVFREPGYRGEVKADIKVDYEKPYIKKMDVVIKNTGKAPIKVGKRYIKNYYKEGEYKKKYTFLMYYNLDTPISSSSNYKVDKIKDTSYVEEDTSHTVKVDKIEYKSQGAKKYKILSADTVVTIKPGEKMSLRFSRKNGKKFNNYLLYARVSDRIHAYSVDYMTIYLFQYMGEKAFIRIGCQELKSGKKHFFAIIEKSEKGEPYQFDD